MIRSRIIRASKILIREGPAPLMRSISMSLRNPLARQYRQWLLENPLDQAGINRMRSEQDGFRLTPTFSVIVPIYNVEEALLRKCLDSVVTQIYGNWELCLADDASDRPPARPLLEEYRARDSRIKVVYLDRNRGISAATNAALELATGDYIALLDNDDELALDALFHVAKLINEHPEADMVYSDEDKINQAGNFCEPFFKPDWSPNLLLSQMYICHLGVYRRSIAEKIGLFREGFDGSQDYDFVLRFTEETDNIFHIARILYHWRIIPGSTAEKYDSKDSDIPSLKALTHAMHRQELPGIVERGLEMGTFRVRPTIRGEPLVSIIIPTRDRSDLLERCLDSIEKRTTWPNFEILVMDNGSRENRSLDYLQRLRERDRYHVIRFDGPFNYAAINNSASREASGEYLIFLNNDTEVETGDWLEAMMEVLQLPEAGAASAKLLYPDDTVQHAGIVMGLGGIANPAFYQTRHSDRTYFNQSAVIRNYSAVTGACMMVSKDIFEELGGFDEENLPIAYNDIDFCLRLNEKGYLVVYTPFAILYHHEAASRGYREDPEAYFMLRNWKEVIDRDPYYNPNLARDRFDFSLKLNKPV